MPTKNPDSSIPQLINRIRHSFRECDFDEVHNTLMDREKNMKDDIQNLVRERDSLKNQLDLLQSTQGFTELEKCSAEEKLGRSERRCEELDKLIVQMKVEIEKLAREKSDLEEKVVRCSRKSEMDDESLVKMKKEIEDLRRENVSANESIEELKGKVIEADRVVEELKRETVEAVKTIDELRAKEIESDKAAELYERNLGHIERTLAKISNVNVEDLRSLANGTANFAAAATDAEVEKSANNFIKSPEVPATSGAWNLAHSGTKEDDANTVCTSKPASSSVVSENNAIVQDNEGQDDRDMHFRDLLSAHMKAADAILEERDRRMAELEAAERERIVAAAALPQQFDTHASPASSATQSQPEVATSGSLDRGLHASVMQSGGEVGAKKTSASSSGAGNVVITVSDSDEDDENKRGGRRGSAINRNRKRKRNTSTTTTTSPSAFHNVEYVDLEDGDGS